jgi:hypothetical protein
MLSVRHLHRRGGFNPIVAAFALTCVWAASADSNPIPMRMRTAHPESPDALGVTLRMALVATLALIAELETLGLLLERKLAVPSSVTAQAFVLVHIVTFPATVLLAQSWGHWAEVLPLTVEPVLIAFAVGTSLSRTWAPVVLANLVSFGIGLVFTIR